MIDKEESIGTKHSDGSWVILAVSRELVSLANSFADVGNIFVYEKLMSKVHRLQEAADLMDKVYGKCVSGAVQNNLDMCDNLLFVLDRSIGGKR